MASRKKTKKRPARASGGGRQDLVHGVILPAAIGAGGALATNGLVNYLPLPDSLKEGRMIFATRFGIAVALAMLGRRLPVVGPYSNRLAIGSLTVTMTDLGKDLALQSGFNLSGVGYISPARVVGIPRQQMRGLASVAGGGVAGAGAFVNRNRAGAFIGR